LPTSPGSSKQSAPLPNSAAELLSQRYPPLGRYWPNLGRVSAPQTGFLVLDHLEAFYGGAAGGGKSDALLAGALQYVDVPGYAALILRRTFKQLSLPGAIMARSKEWLAPFRKSGEVHWNDDDKTWTFPSGATLTFGYLDVADDIYRYQGPEFQYIGFDELTQFSEDQYTYLFSRVRRTVDIPVPLRVRAAANPGGIGHAWVKRRFPIAQGATPAQHEGRIFVPAKVDDNPGLDKAEYEKSLANLSPILRAQLLDGDWGAFEGAAFPAFGPDHLIDEFPLADSFDRIEAMDYGLNGTAWYLIPTDYDGNIVFFDSVYEQNLLPDEVAPLVLAKRADTWGHGNQAHADPAVWHRTGARNKWGAPAMLADEFTDAGVPIVPANNDPRAGLIRLRTLMEPDPERRFPTWHPRRGEFGAPRLFVVAHRCPDLVEQLGTAPLQPIDKADGGEKIDPAWESRYGHATAAARYGVMARPEPSTEPPPVIDDPREAAARRMLEKANQQTYHYV
jgi:hypothetical protein